MRTDHFHSYLGLQTAPRSGHSRWGSSGGWSGRSAPAGAGSASGPGSCHERSHEVTMSGHLRGRVSLSPSSLWSRTLGGLVTTDSSGSDTQRPSDSEAPRLSEVRGSEPRHSQDLGVGTMMTGGNRLASSSLSCGRRGVTFS